MRQNRLALAGWLLLVGVGMLWLGGCGGSETEETPVIPPTRTLVPGTPTPTDPPVTPTITPTALPAAASLSEALPTDAAPASLPPAAQHLVTLTLDDLVERDVSRDEVRLLGLEVFTWPDRSLGCQANYVPGEAELQAVPGYRILYGAGQLIYVYHTDSDAAFVLCRDRDWLGLEGEPLLIDPIARSLVDLAGRDAAQRLDEPAGSLVLASLIAVDWPDSSLGCPQEGGTYADSLTPGYRLVIRTSDHSASLIYHTSIRSFVVCSPEDEILPGVLRDALPDPTPTPAAAD